MTPGQIDAFLAEPRMAHFVTIGGDGRARVRPVWYLWRDGVFWFTTRTQARHTGRELGSHPEVVMSIASEDRPYRAVITRGRPEILPKDEQLLLALSTRYGDEQARRWLPEALAQDDRVVLKLVPESVISWDYGTSD